MDPSDLKENAKRAETLLKALSNEHRLMIMCHLANGELSVSQLECCIDLSQSALSQHLARLRRDGLVQTRRHAQTIYYSLASDEASAIMQTLYELYCATPDPDSRRRGEGSEIEPAVVVASLSGAS